MWDVQRYQRQWKNVLLASKCFSVCVLFNIMIISVEVITFELQSL